MYKIRWLTFFVFDWYKIFLSCFITLAIMKLLVDMMGMVLGVGETSYNLVIKGQCSAPVYLGMNFTVVSRLLSNTLGEAVS